MFQTFLIVGLIRLSLPSSLSCRAPIFVFVAIGLSVDVPALIIHKLILRGGDFIQILAIVISLRTGIVIDFGVLVGMWVRIREVMAAAVKRRMVRMMWVVVGIR